MTVNDVKIGDLVVVHMTGSYYTSVVDINETQICIGAGCYSGGWFDKSLFYIVHDMTMQDYCNNVDEKTKPEILAIQQGEICHQLNLRDKND